MSILEFTEEDMIQLRQEEKEEARAEGRVEGLAQGLEEGCKKGREEGLAQGLEEGCKKGREEERKVTASIINNLFKKDYTIEEISELIDLPVDTINEYINSESVE